MSRFAAKVVPGAHEIIIPELKEAGKTVEVIEDKGQPHNFVFGQQGSPEATRKCFDDCHAFFKKYLPTQGVALEDSLVKEVAVSQQ